VARAVNALLAAGALFASTRFPSLAGAQVNVNVQFGRPRPAPVVVVPQQQPVYAQPAPQPVYVQPAPQPVYVQQAPVYQQPPGFYRGRRGRRAPVVVQTPSGVYVERGRRGRRWH
jgi:hypothetical protein